VPFTTVVRMYSNRQQAEFGKMVLEASRVPSFIRGDDAGGTQPFLAGASGMRLIVRTEDIERAEDILRESESAIAPTDKDIAEPPAGG
jgi:hypothetical protein